MLKETSTGEFLISVLDKSPHVSTQLTIGQGALGVLIFASLVSF